MDEEPGKVMPFPPRRSDPPVTLAPSVRSPVPILVERSPGVDLNGKVKAVFFIGRGPDQSGARQLSRRGRAAPLD